MAKTATIRQVRFIPAPPKKVYEAYMDAKKHAMFTGSKAAIDARVGGKFSAWDGYVTGKNLELVPGRKIVQEWQTSEWPKGYGPSILEIALSEKDGGTELAMTHSRVPAEQADEYRKGWIDYYWDPLKRHFATT